MKQRIRVKNHKKTPRIYEPVENVLDLLKHLEKHGERTAFVWPGKKRKDPENRMTYRAFTDEVKWISAAIELSGLRGGRIAVIGASSQAWVASYLGVLASDSVVIPMDKELTEDAILGFLESVNATAVFYDTALSRTFESIADKSTLLTHLISMNGESVPEDARFYTFERWLKIGEEGVAGGYEYPPVTDSRKLAEMLFTSGTTGSSKCVMLCQENVFSVVTSACETVDFGPDDVVLSVLPLHHTYELACMLALLNYGATSAINDSLPHVLTNLQRFKPTGIIVVPLYVNTFHKRIWAEAQKSGKEKTLRRGIKLSDFLLACGIAEVLLAHFALPVCLPAVLGAARFLAVILDQLMSLRLDDDRFVNRLRTDHVGKQFPAPDAFPIGFCSVLRAGGIHLVMLFQRVTRCMDCDRLRDLLRALSIAEQLSAYHALPERLHAVPVACCFHALVCNCQMALGGNLGEPVDRFISL